jgi:ferric-dicitrate binding protein FerR (iron transport regulator)
MNEERKNNNIHDLMLRYLDNTGTQSERKELSRRISLLSDDELLTEIEKVWKDYKPETKMSEEESLSIINNIFKKETVGKKFNSRNLIYVLSAAASVGILVILSFFARYHSPKQEIQTQSVWVEGVRISPETKVNYTRNHTLPDGSHVILQGNSVICFLNDFTGNTREISLSGQAYFDIAPNREKPFIIHTGAIKTTVLGTAFNIKALSEEKEITVSVKRGRVKVEDNSHLLAVLTESQELHYSKVEPGAVSTPVATTEEIAVEWTREDMKFDHVPLRDVASVLSKRYGVTIEIVGMDLAGSEIVAFFGGTESMEDVLKILCDINSKTHYEIKNDRSIVISSEESTVK